MRDGASVFVDEAGRPVASQTELLLTLPRTAPQDVRDALADLREITLELKGLWDYLGGALGRAA